MVHLPCGGVVPRSKLSSEVMLSSTKPARPQSRWTGQPWPAPIPVLQQPPKNKAGLLLPNALLHTPVSFTISPCILLLYGWENLIPDSSSLSYHQQWRKTRGYILASFVKDKVSICAWIYLWAFYFVPLIYISVFVPVPYCLDNCGFVVEPEVR